MASDLPPPATASSPATNAFRFGRYQLFASLGRGGMADVYLAVARGPMGFHKLTVIKRLKPALATEASFRQMFLDEARLAARLSHPNVVHTYEVGEEDGAYFIAMEYIEGQSLNRVMKQVLRRGERLDAQMAARMMADALAGLAYAHELADYDGRPLRVIHRDVSPHNLLLGYDGHVKVVDFGIAKAALSSTETEIGVLKGKVAYMAPEQATGGAIDARADLFAVGIVLWELLAHKRLMAADSAAVTLHRLMNDRFERVSDVVPDVDPRLDAIVAKALERDPDRRWASAREFQAALERVLATPPEGKPLVRHEDAGRFVGGLFTGVRDEVHKQIQLYMESIDQATSGEELQSLTRESLRRIQGVSPGSEQLLKLSGVEGSGSGAIPPSVPPPAPSLPDLALAAAATASANANAAVAQMQLDAARGGHSAMMALSVAGQRPAQRSLLPLILASLLGVALLVILLLLVRPNDKKDGATSPSASGGASASAASGDVSGSASGSGSQAPGTSGPGSSAPPIPPASAVAIATGDPPSATPAAPAAPASASTSAHRPRGAPPSSPSPAPADEGPGFLTLDTYPWTRVSEAGKSLGTTPLVHVSLPPGEHSLTLENPDQGIHQLYEVTIKSGDTVSHRLGLK